MYRVKYFEEEKKKDLTYDEALFSSLNNNNTKWGNYYGWLKEKYDLCYNVESLEIDVSDIKKMKYDCFSNGMLLKLYLLCQQDHILEKCDRVSISNNSIFAEELIYNILKAEWLIDERLVNPIDNDLVNRKNYFEAMISVSEDSQDIKVQFRNKLYSYFLEVFNCIKENKEIKEKDKVLRLENNEFK